MMAANGKRSARERLDAAKAKLPEVERGIALAIEVRKRALIDDQSEAIVAEANRHLAYLRQRRQDLLDTIEWLPALVSAEESEAANPSTVAGIDALIDRMSPELRTLEARPRKDRSAADDARIDHLRQRIPALQQRRQHIALMERMAP
jgi:hypothetical protein